MLSFQNLVAKLMSTSPPRTCLMDQLLAPMGLSTEGVAPRPRIPYNVVAGCVPELVTIPGTQRPAFRKDGTPITYKTSQGRELPVMESEAMPRKLFKQLTGQEARRRRGRYVGPFPTHGKKARLNAEAN